MTSNFGGVQTHRSVAIDVTPLAAFRTGIARSIAELLTGLALLDNGPRIVPYAVSTRARRERDQLPDGTRTVPGASSLIKLWSRSDRPRIDHIFGDASVVHATNFLVPPSRLPTVATLHDCSIVRHRSLCSTQVRALEPVIRRAINRGAHLHVPSQFVADETEELFGPDLRAAGRIHVVHWGVPTIPTTMMVPAELARFGAIANGVPYIVAVGTLEPRKNIAHLVAAFGPLAATDPDLHLVVVGADGPARPEIDAARARLAPKLAERVVLTGSVAEPAKGWLIRNARALAYPSVYEGFGFPMLEAMSVGVPVVAARAGSIPEIAGGAATLVEPTDEAAMSAALTSLLNDEVARGEHVQRGLARANQFSWSACAAGVNAIYELLST